LSNEITYYRPFNRSEECCLCKPHMPYKAQYFHPVEEMLVAELLQSVHERAIRSTASRKMIAPETGCVTQGIRDVLMQNHIEILNVVVGKSGILNATDIIA
jgi:hypothetical protein